jgi:polyisoprenoid-binding protein YceI
MKSILLVISGLWCFTFAQQPMTTFDNDSQVKFNIKHFGLSVIGSIQGLEGTVRFDPADLFNSQMNVSLMASTINTGNESRDNHLKKKDYFDVIQFPKITFKSKFVTAAQNPGTYIVNGTLFLKGLKKDINIPFTAKPKNNGYQFNGTFQMNRREFGIGGSSISLSDNLTIYLSIITK